MIYDEGYAIDDTPYQYEVFQDALELNPSSQEVKAGLDHLS